MRVRADRTDMGVAPFTAAAQRPSVRHMHLQLRRFGGSRCRCSPFGAVPTRSHQGCNELPQNRLQVVAYPCERKSKKSLASETNDPKKSLAPVTNEILSLANEIVAVANEILALANDPVFWNHSRSAQGLPVPVPAAGAAGVPRA